MSTREIEAAARRSVGRALLRKLDTLERQGGVDREIATELRVSIETLCGVNQKVTA